MPLQKLESADAFVVRDLDADIPAVGIVRSAPKILQGGAKELARSQTYQCAVLGLQQQGASAGVNAAPEDRDGALEAFSTELLAAAEAGQLMLDPAKGVTAAQLAPLIDVDQRSAMRRLDVDGIPNSAHLTGLGAVAAAQAVRSLDGASIAIEGFDEVGVAVARAATAAGAKILAVATPAGAAFADDGFDAAALASAFASSGAGMVKELSDAEEPFWKVLGADVDVLFVGSKMGVIDHNGAANVKATLVVPIGPIPYTTKGSLVLQNQGSVVLPDFVTTAGGLLAGITDTDDQATLEASVTERISGLVGQIVDKSDSAVLEACYLAEEFLRSWRDELPFGRPFAP